jgi:adenylate kinase family enzyme
MKTEIGKRIVVVGTSGVGKSTLSASLSQTLSIPYIELDALFWNENWTGSSDELFTQRVQDALQAAGEAWVVDGNYGLTRSLVWPKADTVIWLDYPLWLIYWRLLQRALKRILSQELVWGKNRETFANQFLAKDSLFVWATTTYKRRRETYLQIMAENAFPHIHFFHFRSPKETEAFLKAIAVSVR